MAEQEEWLTVTEFCYRYTFKPSTLRGWFQRGRAYGDFRDGEWWIKVRRTGPGVRDVQVWAPPKMPPIHQGVYFIECGEFIKIGYAEDVLARFKFINMASPFRCQPLAYLHTPTYESAKALEKAWHQRFWSLHERHEWFRGVPRLRDAITMEAMPWPTRNVKRKPTAR